MKAIQRHHVFQVLSSCACFLSLIGCGTTSAVRGGPIPIPVQAGYPSASTQNWLTEFASTGAPGLQANQSNSPTDALPGAAGTSSGGVVLSGYTLGAYQGFSATSGTAQAVVMKYDNKGARQWLTQFGSGSGDFLVAAAVDRSEDIYVTGSTNGTYPGQVTFSGTKALLVKLDKNGNRLWLKEFNFGPSNASLTAVTTDETGAVFVGGLFTPLPSSGTQHAFVMRFDPGTGMNQWTVQYGADGVITSLNGVAAANGGVYIVGSNLSATTPMQQTTDVQRVASANAVPVWSRDIHASTSSTYLLSSVVMGLDGNPVIGGSVSSLGHLSVGFGADSSASGYLSKLDATSGKNIWATTVSSGAGDQITSLTSVGSNLYAAGNTNGALSSAYTAQLAGDFLLKTDGNGNVTWVQQFGTGRIINIETPYGLVAASDGASVYIAGPTQIAFPGFTSNGLIQNFVSSWGP